MLANLFLLFCVAFTLRWLWVWFMQRRAKAFPFGSDKLQDGEYKNDVRKAELMHLSYIRLLPKWLKDGHGGQWVAMTDPNCYFFGQTEADVRQRLGHPTVRNFYIGQVLEEDERIRYRA